MSISARGDSGVMAKRLGQNLRWNAGAEIHRAKRRQYIAAQVRRIEPMHVDQVFGLPGEQALRHRPKARRRNRRQ